MKNSILLNIEYYTDPLCCWSWAFEPQWRRLRYEFDGAITWKYRMSGMIPDWHSYNDTLNSVSRSTQMGALCREAMNISGMPVDDALWVENPPASSYPACLAVKTAQLQGSRAEDLYLRKLREAAMTKKKNIADRQVLLYLAHEVAVQFPGTLDHGTFEKDLREGAALHLFREDMDQVKVRGITRYPTLIVRNNEGRGIVITGYRPYDMLLENVRQLIPVLPRKEKTGAAHYRQFWDEVITAREVEEVTMRAAPAERIIH